jgi:hypothetical protein
MGSTAFWFDRKRRFFAMATKDAAPEFGKRIEVNGRSFLVADWIDAEKASAPALLMAAE